VCGTCTSGGSALGGKPLSDDALTILMAISAAGVVGIMDWSGAASFNRSLRREIGAHLHRFLGYHLPGYRLPTALDLLRAGKEDGR